MSFIERIKRFLGIVSKPDESKDEKAEKEEARYTKALEKARSELVEKHGLEKEKLLLIICLLFFSCK